MKDTEIIDLVFLTESINVDAMVERKLHNMSKDELIDMFFNYGFDADMEENIIDDIEDFDDDEIIDMLLSELSMKQKRELL